jgi:hypothetical protein
MTVFIVQHDRVIYSVFDSRAKAEAYINDTWVESFQSQVHIVEEKVL